MCGRESVGERVCVWESVGERECGRESAWERARMLKRVRAWKSESVG